MKNTIFAFCAIAVLSLSACSATPGESQATTTDSSIPAATSTATADTTKSVWNDIKPTPGSTIPANPSAKSATSASAPALNPEHGQPGHRCDLAVGAPLNSAQPQSQPTAPPAKSLPTIAPSNQGSAKLNPAHGQPGHDCAVPVGQPLKTS